MDGYGTKFFINDRWVELKELVEKAEKWDNSLNPDFLVITQKDYYGMKDEIDKIDATKSWWSVFNQTIDSPDAKDRLAEVLGVEV